MKHKDEIDHIVSLIKNADKEGLSALALLSKPDDTHRFICDFRGEPLRILLELGKPLDDSILVRAKGDSDPYIVALAKTRLGEPLGLDLMDRVISAYGRNASTA